MQKDKIHIIKSRYSIKNTNSVFLSTPSYRNMLNNIHIGCYIEAESTGQGGDVIEIIRDKNQIPVCIKVSYKPENSKRAIQDYISVDRISFYEPYDFVVSNEEYYDDDDDWGMC